MRPLRSISSVELLESRTLLSAYSITNLHGYPTGSADNETDVSDSPDINTQGNALINIEGANHITAHGNIFGPAATFPDGLVDRTQFSPDAEVDARDINDLDQIVGDYSRAPDGVFHAFLSETGKHGRVALTTLINLPGFTNSIAHGINTSAQVVGQSDTNTTNATAWIWQRGKKSREVVTELPALGSNPIIKSFHEQTEAIDINDSGAIVGMSYNDMLAERAVIWRPGKKGRYAATDLGALPAPLPTSKARAINNAGYAVGYSLANDSHQHAVLFAPGKKGRYSVVQLPDFAGADTEATGINSQNQIVGIAKKFNGENHAVLWQPGKHGRYTIVDLFNQGGQAWQLNEATDINDAGTIVGTGITEGGDATWRLTPASSVSSPAAVVGSPFSTLAIVKADKDLLQ